MARNAATLRAVHTIALLLQRLRPLYAAPLTKESWLHVSEEAEPVPADDPSKWAYLGTAIALVLLGGAFAGLTIALMGQDEIYLQVIASSGEKSEQRNAQKVLKLLNRGKHWVLVTLLLANVITNETLPIVLDRSLGGGWPAVLSSTILIVIFGEIAPQSVCVRYGLPIGAWMSPFVLGLMWILAPFAWPTARLLDWLLGADHGTTYKKDGLKTLVTLHKTLGPSPSDRLNEDEVTIITAVLDLKDKQVGNIMTPMEDAFTLSANAVLDEGMMDEILSAGYSRIPIHAPDNDQNFVGMLLVKMLITYDPEDALRVQDFALATLPETRPETSCLDIVNYFQQGKSHMVLVSEMPGEAEGAIGVVTLEDVIEELIGEEIIDESDVFVDVHKAIRRLVPAPRTKLAKTHSHDSTNAPKVIGAGRDTDTDNESQPRATNSAGHRKPSMDRSHTSNFVVRRRSSGGDAADKATHPFRGDSSELKEHLRHLGPSNLASRPKPTRISAVKIKPGADGPRQPDIQQQQQIQKPVIQSRFSSPLLAKDSAVQGGVGEGLVSPGLDARDGTHAVMSGYGTITGGNFSPKGDSDSKSGGNAGDASALGTSLPTVSEIPHSKDAASRTSTNESGTNDRTNDQSKPRFEVREPSPSPGKSNPKDADSESEEARNQVGSLSASGAGVGTSSVSRSPSGRRAGGARSGSLTENTVDLGGMKKVVLETTSSSDDADHHESSNPITGAGYGHHHGIEDDEDDAKGDEDVETNGAKKKKTRRKRGRKNKKGGASGDGKADESKPLLG